MKAWEEKDVEKLIKNSRFQDSAHKNALRGRLFDETVPLSPDDLEMVAGGVAIAGQDQWEIWPDPEEEKP